MKKAVKQAVVDRLKREQRDIRGKIHQNKLHMKVIVFEQTSLKRQLPALQELIRSLT